MASSRAERASREAIESWIDPLGVEPDHRINEEWVQHFAQTLDAYAEQTRKEERQACAQECVRVAGREQRRGNLAGMGTAEACVKRIRARGGEHG